METQIPVTDKKVNKTAILLIATIASFLSPFMAISINIALPTISSELAVNAILLSWISTAYLLTSAMLAVPFGRIADIYGMKKIFTYGIVILTVCFFFGSYISLSRISYYNPGCSGYWKCNDICYRTCYGNISISSQRKR